MMITGIEGLISFIAFSTDVPSMSSSLKSQRIKSGASSLRSSSAFFPLFASITWKPCLDKNRLSTRHRSFSSSTIRIFAIYYLSDFQFMLLHFGGGSYSNAFVLLEYVTHHDILQQCGARS